MIGLVLSGGESQRMGMDKGMLKIGNTSWVEIAIEKLQALNLPVIVSLNKHQQDKYVKSLDSSRVVIDDLTLTVKGPLLGILSVHRYFPEDDCFVLACDMLDMPSVIMQQLVTAQSANPSFDAWLFETDGQTQPLCAIYSCATLSRFYRLAAEGKLPKYSMKYVLDNADTYIHPADPSMFPYFKNYNLPDDLR